MKKTKKALAMALALTAAAASMTMLLSSATEENSNGFYVDGIWVDPDDSIACPGENKPDNGNTRITDPNDPDYAYLAEVSGDYAITSPQHDYRNLSDEEFFALPERETASTVENIIRFLELSDDEVRAELYEIKEYNEDEANIKKGWKHGFGWGVRWLYSEQHSKYYGSDAPLAVQPVLMGDVNEDYSIDSNDALKVLKKVVDIDNNFTIEQTIHADVNKDDKVTIEDALQILRYTVGLIDEF